MDIEELKRRYKAGERDFAGISLRGNTMNVLLDGANLRGADLSECKILSPYFREANLSKVNLSGTDIDGRLFDCNLERANLQGATGLGFVNCNMRGVNLNDFRFLPDESGIHNCVVDEASLRGTVFRACVPIHDSSFRSTNWEDVLGEEIMMANVDLTGSRINQSAGIVSPSIYLENVTLANGQYVEGIVVGGSIRHFRGIKAEEIEQMRRFN